jgi:hypothetical protein
MGCEVLSVHSITVSQRLYSIYKHMRIQQNALEGLNSTATRRSIPDSSQKATVRYDLAVSVTVTTLATVVTCSPKKLYVLQF